MADPPDFSARVSEAYKTETKAIPLGRAVHNGEVFAGAAVQVPISMLNRHGLIAGATGTGKTRTLQLLAEALSSAGVSVFAADIKGDLSGLTQPGVANEKIDQRARELGITWTPAASAVSFLALGGLGPGVPIRATVSSFGPQLLAKVLDANETQTSSLALVFHYADEKGLALLDLDDLRAVLQYLSSKDGKAELTTIGGLSTATVGVLLRKILELETQGAEAFFGEPELDVADLMRTVDGKGIVSCLELSSVQDKPRLFSTFLMWLLAELFEHLPEVGDLDAPKLVFFFDEAHLLFEGASKPFVEQVAQTVRLIRSKGVGVFFITQLPDDVPEDVLAQLGNRVQHALRAITPRDAKALRAAVTTYPKTDDYDLAEVLTQLGIGEAVVTVLSERGVPTPVVWTRMLPPASAMAAIPIADIDAAAKADVLWAQYSASVDRESAREILAEKMAASTDAAAEEKRAPSGKAPKRPAPPKQPRGSGKKDENPITDYLKSREGRSTINTVVRGMFGLLKKKR